MPYKRLVDALFAVRGTDSAGILPGDTPEDIETLVVALEKGRGAFSVDDIALIIEGMNARCFHHPFVTPP